MDGRAYRKLEVWNRGMDLVDQIYAVTRRLLDDERFGLISQMRRAAVSIPVNIAEGYGRKSRQDYARFVAIARGSLIELETLLMIAVRQDYLSRDLGKPVWQIAQEVGRMLTRLHDSLANPQPPDPSP